MQTARVTYSSAQQRKGRAGRTAPGVCYRLYSKEDELSMAPTQIAEVLRSPLELTILNLKKLGNRCLHDAPSKHHLSSTYQFAWICCLHVAYINNTCIHLLSPCMRQAPGHLRLLLRDLPELWSEPLLQVWMRKTLTGWIGLMMTCCTMLCSNWFGWEHWTSRMVRRPSQSLAGWSLIFRCAFSAHWVPSSLLLSTAEDMHCAQHSFLATNACM